MSENKQIYRLGEYMDRYRRFIGEFLKMSEIRYCDKGELIDSPQGEAMHSLHLVVSGVIECSFVSSTGQKKITGFMESGVFIGMSALDGYLNHHTFSCRTSAVVASAQVEKIDSWDTDMLMSLVMIQTNKVRLSTNQIIDQYLEPVQVKTARLLLELAGPPKEAGGHEVPLIVNITKQDVADSLGVSREHASKVLSEMQKSGILELHGRDIIFYPSKLSSLTSE